MQTSSPEAPPVSDQSQRRYSFMNRQLSARGIGVVALTSGSLLTFLCVLLPLFQASHHEEHVSISLKGIGLTPLILAFGTAFTFFPKTAPALLGHPQKPTWFSYVFSIFFLLLGIPLYLLVKSKLREYGYIFRILGTVTVG
jgi:threonine/homoserine/homoserine lactone efflux protein